MSSPIDRPEKTGGYMTADELARMAQYVLDCNEMLHRDAAHELGISESRISRGVNGHAPTVANRIIREIGDCRVVSGLYYVAAPDDLDAHVRCALLDVLEATN